MSLGTLTNHFSRVINFSFATGLAFMNDGVIELVIWANRTVLAIEIRVLLRTVLAFSRINIVELLVRAIFTFKIRIIPILRMLTLDTILSIPIIICSFITDAFFQCIVINLIIRT